MKDVLQKMIDYLDSPEGEANIEKYVAKLNKEHERIEEKKSFYDRMTNAEFKAHVIAEEAKQSYEYGVPTTDEINDITRVMIDFGKPYSPKDWKMFATSYTRYKGLTAILFQGQGSFVRINSGKKTLLQTN
jgi:hypothetical protein